MIASLRGMNDIIFDESDKFRYFIDNATAIAKRYGYGYIQTPILEETALFKRSVGESSDIVGKEMYQFIDKGENDVCLRPEGTAGVVRSFVQKKLDRTDGEYRFFYYGPMFRYERPQKGRLRSFHQFGCESFGVDSVYEDANIIFLIKEILDFFNIKYTIKLNSLGCKECMPAYKTNLVKHLESFKAELCEDCQRRIITNPIRVLDCKNTNCQTLLTSAPKITNSLCENCNQDFEKLKQILSLNSVEYEIDSSLVRGLDYYTKTAFEFVSGDIGAQNAISGGGRYDRLVEFLDGKATPAIGFAIGVERILDLITIPDQERNGYYFGTMVDGGVDIINTLGNKLRKEHNTYIEYKPKKLKNLLKGADKVGARFCAVIGEDELQNNKIWIKDLVMKVENIVDINEL